MFPGMFLLFLFLESISFDKNMNSKQLIKNKKDRWFQSSDRNSNAEEAYH